VSSRDSTIALAIRNSPLQQTHGKGIAHLLLAPGTILILLSLPLLLRECEFVVAPLRGL